MQQLWQDQHQERVTTGMRQTAHYPSTAANPFSSLAEAALQGKGKWWSLWNLAINTCLDFMNSCKEKDLPQRDLLPWSEMPMKCTEALQVLLFVWGLIYTTERICSWSRVSKVRQAACCLAAAADTGKLPSALRQKWQLRSVTGRWQPDAACGLGISVSSADLHLVHT